MRGQLFDHNCQTTKDTKASGPPTTRHCLEQVDQTHPVLAIGTLYSKKVDQIHPVLASGKLALAKKDQTIQ